MTGGQAGSTERPRRGRAAVSPNADYPQPHEGITGAARDDDLLSLEDAAVPRRMLMAGMARCLRDAVLVGNPAPSVARMWERMKTPVPGDLVIETSTFYRRNEDDRVKAMGILVAHRVEWWETDEEWAAQIEEERAAYEEFLRGSYSQPGDGPFDPSACERCTDHAWYVQYGPQAGDVCRWVNCDFMMIPADPSAFRVQVGTRDGNGVMFTRDDLIGSLADSGFTLRRSEPEAAGQADHADRRAEYEDLRAEINRRLGHPSAADLP